MRLSNIKLSGFKSFVDPTDLIISKGLVGVVGPNGCGKSNIIDAVTWVMGESSAKHLRGENLIDVIFNGSQARQPVSKASVELIFDNSEKKLAGQYASYNVISIKRQITRDAISTYYLNGSRCRRRDIAEIFLGTGIGPRSYAIIEQGMISRLIEAKPEELRNFIEEAAGISKYKERRKETENRIKHTKENIERLNDISDELKKQLKHLQYQSKTAERYKELKNKERKLNSELIALNWHDLNNNRNVHIEKSKTNQNELDLTLANIRKIEAFIEAQREQLNDANHSFNNIQSEYYKIGGEISRYEQNFKHSNEKNITTKLEIEKSRRSYDKTSSQHEEDKLNFAKTLNEISSLEPSLEKSNNETDKAYKVLGIAEHDMQSWHKKWDDFNEEFAEIIRKEQESKTRLEHLEINLDEISERYRQYQIDINKYKNSDLKSKVEELQTSLDKQESLSEKMIKLSANIQQQVKNYRERSKFLNNQLDKEKHKYQLLQGKLISLETLQKSFLNDNEELKDWLLANKLNKNKRLLELIKVDSKWIHALETVTSAYLDSVCVDDISSLIYKLKDVSGSFSLINTSVVKLACPKNNWLRLIDKITSDICVPFILNTIYIAEDVEQVMNMLPELPEDHSIVTKDGLWLNKNWVFVNNSIDKTDVGILTREKEIIDTKKSLQQVELQIETTEGEAREIISKLDNAEKNLSKNQIELNSKQQYIADIRADLASNQTKLKQQSLSYKQLTENIEDIRQQSEVDKVEIESIKNTIDKYKQEKTKYISRKVELSTIKEKHYANLNELRNNWQINNEKRHSIAIKLESYRSLKSSSEQAIKRNEVHLKNMHNHILELEDKLLKDKSPLQDIQSKIESLLTEKNLKEKGLSKARACVEDIEKLINESMQNRNEYEQKLEKLRIVLEEEKIALNSCQIKMEGIEEQLASYKLNTQNLLESLDEHANKEEKKGQLESLSKKIHNLGPINLTAIDEYQQHAERKTYLDSQGKDLNDALTTLENAIYKIDKETCSLFKGTFNKLNENIRDIFPKLFGGGSAYLELTGDNILETGVSIIARPPGKKNSNIHLLSGGEKALIAIVLVFSIFKLNPAPFCILDEVDAPLDDSNAILFSQLVKSLANDIQFIFITHNKTTMDIAEQLIGITMREEGVSKLVSVNLEEAI